MKTKSETKALATWKKINTANRKQIHPLQSNNQTHMDSLHPNTEILQRYQSKTGLVMGSYQCGNEISD